MALEKPANTPRTQKVAPGISLAAIAALSTMFAGKAMMTGCAESNKPDIAAVSSSPQNTPPQNPNKFPGTIDSTKLNTIFVSAVRRTDVLNTLFEFRAELIGDPFDPQNPTKKGSLPAQTAAPYEIVFRYEEPKGKPREVRTNVSTQPGGNKIAFVPRTITDQAVTITAEIRKNGQTVVPPTEIKVSDISDRTGYSLGSD